MRLRRANLGTVLPIGALLCIAVALAGCGSSSSSATAPAPKTVSASVMAQAADKAAAQPGYAFNFKLASSGAVTHGAAAAAGSGELQADRVVGRLTASVTLPGNYSMMGVLRTEVLATGHGLYVEVPGGLANLLGGKQWLAANPAQLSAMLGSHAAHAPKLSSASPSKAFKTLAAASTGKAIVLGTATVAGQTVTHYQEVIRHGSDPPLTVGMWIGSDGLPHQISAAFASHGERGLVTVAITSFAAQTAPSAPPPSEVGSLAHVIQELSQSGVSGI